MATRFGPVGQADRIEYPEDPGNGTWEGVCANRGKTITRRKRHVFHTGGGEQVSRCKCGLLVFVDLAFK